LIASSEINVNFNKSCQFVTIILQYKELLHNSKQFKSSIFKKTNSGQVATGVAKYSQLFCNVYRMLSPDQLRHVGTGRDGRVPGKTLGLYTIGD
jgi:hypothetical protein